MTLPILDKFDVVAEIDQTIVMQVIKAFIKSKMITDYPLTTDPNQPRSIFFSDVTISFPTGNFNAILLKFNYKVDIFSNFMEFLAGDITIDAKIKLIYEDKSLTHVALEITNIAFSPFLLQPLGTKTESELNVLLGGFNDLLGIPKKKKVMEYIRDKINDTLKTNLKSIPITPTLSKLTKYTGFSIDRVLAQLYKDPNYSFNDIGIGILLSGSNKKANLSDIVDIRNGNDFGLAVNKRMIEYRFQQFYNKMPKNYNYSGKPDDTGHLTIRDLSLSFGDGYLKIGGEIMWSDYGLSVSLEFEGKIYLELKDNKLICYTEDVELSLDWFTKIILGVLSGGILWIIIEVVEEVAEYFMEDIDLSKMLMSAVGDYLSYSLPVPGTSIIIDILINTFEVHDNGLRILGNYKTDEKVVEPIPWPPKLHVPEVKMYQGKKETETIPPSYWEAVIQSEELTDEEYEFLQTHELSALVELFPDQSKDNVQKEFKTFCVKGKTHVVDKYDIDVTAEMINMPNNLTLVWDKEKKNEKNSIVHEVLTPTANSTTKKSKVKTSETIPEALKPAVLLVPMFGFGTGPNYAAFGKRDLTGINWMQFKTNLKVIRPGELLPKFASFKTSFPWYYNEITDVFGGDSEQDFKNWVKKKTEQGTEKHIAGLANDILMQTLKMTGAVMQIQLNEGDPQAMKENQQQDQQLKNSASYANLKKALSEFTEESLKTASKNMQNKVMNSSNQSIMKGSIMNKSNMLFTNIGKMKGLNQKANKK